MFTCGPITELMLEGWILRFRDFLNLSFSYFDQQWQLLLKGKADHNSFKLAACKLSELVNWTSGNWSWIETSKHLGIRIAAFKLATKTQNLITVYISVSVNHILSMLSTIFLEVEVKHWNIWELESQHSNLLRKCGIC